MEAVILTKKQLIEKLERDLTEDDAIIVSTVLDGNLKCFDKKKQYQIPFAIPYSPFKRNTGVGKFALMGPEAEHVYSSAIIVCRKDQLSELALEIINA